MKRIKFMEVSPTEAGPIEIGPIEVGMIVVRSFLSMLAGNQPQG